MDNVQAYDARADTISVSDITSDSRNRIILRRLQRNNADERHKIVFIQNEHDIFEQDEEGCTNYCPEGANDMGWLGYFVGKHEFLEELYIYSFTPRTSGSSVRDVLVPFLRGVSRNKSIREIYLVQTDLLGGDLFTMLGPFFQNNYNLTSINVTNCDFGDEGCRLFALALGSSTHKSLRKVVLEDNNIEDEGMIDIITALRMHPNLEYLDLDGNCLRKNGCVALATLLRGSANELQHLYISSNEIGDEGLEVLLPALKNCTCLEILRLSNNPLITTRGWQRLASVLEAPNSNLEGLYISRNNIDDEAMAAFANALANNRTLITLNLGNDPSISAEGSLAFSKLLCNTSSVNATFLSNHTLRSVGTSTNENGIMQPLLRLNRRINKKEIAVIKTLQNHEDFDMLPFFEWEFKCLPLVLDWLERASAYEMPRNFEPNIERRKLSTMYQFVRGLPLLYVESCLRKELEDIKAEESQMEDEQLLLDHRKQLAQERKASIMRRLGQQ